MQTATIELPPKLVPVFLGEARYRGAYGGRGSAKTRSFAKMTAIKAYQHSMECREGIILCCREFMNSLDDSSMSEIKAAILSEPWLAQHFDIGEKYIRTRDGRVSYVFAGLRHNLDSIKSKARILLCWIDEAEPVTEEAWQKLIPTVREDDSEIWVTWNPEREQSATNERFRLKATPDMKIIELNWVDNPFFPKVLNDERLRDFVMRPDEYGHIWDGDYKTVFKGAYYVHQISQARTEGRIGFVPADPLMTFYAVLDIGGTGAKADACAIWVVQFIGSEIRLLKYYEAVGQELAVHVNWLRSNGYSAAHIILPHDGAQHDKVFNVSYESAFASAGFDVTVVPNQGQGAAMARIEEARRQFPSMRFDATGCEIGIRTLAAYKEKWDERRNIGLGPSHDYASHCGDAFGLVATAKAQGIGAPLPKVDVSAFLRRY